MITENRLNEGLDYKKLINNCKQNMLKKSTKIGDIFDIVFPSTSGSIREIAAIKKYLQNLAVFDFRK